MAFSLKHAFRNATVAHLVVDMQHAYCDPRHMHSVRHGLNLKKHHATAVKLNDFVCRSRSCAPPIWIVHDFKEAFLDPSRFCRKDLYLQTPMDRDPVIVKREFDAFYQTGLNDLLKKRDIDTVLISGVYLQVCVRDTALSALKHKYRVFLLENLVANGTDLAAVNRAFIDRSNISWKRLTTARALKIMHDAAPD